MYPPTTTTPPPQLEERADVDPSLPPGVISFTQPPQFSTSFFKIASGEPITFAWTATYIRATPTSLTLKAVASGFTYPIGPNSDGTIPGTATSVVWDVYSYYEANKQTPLVNGMYQMQVYDERGPGAAITAGHLTPNQNLKFGLYTPKPYTPMSSGWTCPSCNNGSVANMAGNPLAMALVITFLVMFLSGFSLMRRRL